MAIPIQKPSPVVISLLVSSAQYIAGRLNQVSMIIMHILFMGMWIEKTCAFEHVKLQIMIIGTFIFSKDKMQLN